MELTVEEKSQVKKVLKRKKAGRTILFYLGVFCLDFLAEGGVVVVYFVFFCWGCFWGEGSEALERVFQ